MQTVYFAEIVDMLINNRDLIKSLKREKAILINEVAMIGEKLVEIEKDFNSCSIEFDNELANKPLNYSKLDNIESTGSTELKKLAKLAKKYKKLARLFKKYTKQLVEIDLELISYASIKESKSLEIPVNTNKS